MAGIIGAAALEFTASECKVKAIAAALSVCNGSFMFLGLDSEGLGTRNEMIIDNGTGATLRLHQYYIHWGKVKVAPAGILTHKERDLVLFHAAGGWAMSGSSGIVTYELDKATYLHVMWDCPISFTFSDNFIGLFISGKSEMNPDGDLFKRMYQDVDAPGMNPKRLSTYDLVCCGPGDGTYVGGKGATGRKTWGVRRPCEVKNDMFYANMTMGDRHETQSRVTILKREFWPDHLQ